MIRILRYTPVNKGFVLGMFDFEYTTEWGVMFQKKCTLFQKDGRRWISFYSEVHDKDGKKNYYPICGFKERKDSEKFQEDIKKSLDKYFEMSGDRLIDSFVKF